MTDGRQAGNLPEWAGAGTPGSGSGCSVMTYRSKLFNFKWTIADTDKIIRWAKAGWDAVAIADAISIDNKPMPRTTPNEVMKICADAGQHVRNGE